MIICFIIVVAVKKSKGMQLLYLYKPFLSEIVTYKLLFKILLVPGFYIV